MKKGLLIITISFMSLLFSNVSIGATFEQQALADGYFAIQGDFNHNSIFHKIFITGGNPPLVYVIVGSLKNDGSYESVSMEADKIIKDCTIASDKMSFHCSTRTIELMVGCDENTGQYFLSPNSLILHIKYLITADGNPEFSPSYNIQPNLKTFGSCIEHKAEAYSGDRPSRGEAERGQSDAQAFWEARSKNTPPPSTEEPPAEAASATAPTVVTKNILCPIGAALEPLLRKMTEEQRKIALQEGFLTKECSEVFSALKYKVETDSQGQSNLRLYAEFQGPSGSRMGPISRSRKFPMKVIYPKEVDFAPSNGGLEAVLGPQQGMEIVGADGRYGFRPESILAQVIKRGADTITIYNVRVVLAPRLAYDKIKETLAAAEAAKAAEAAAAAQAAADAEAAAAAEKAAEEAAAAAGTSDSDLASGQEPAPVEVGTGEAEKETAATGADTGSFCALSTAAPFNAGILTFLLGIPAIAIRRRIGKRR